MIKLSHYSLDTFEGTYYPEHSTAVFNTQWGPMAIMANRAGIFRIFFLTDEDINDLDISPVIPPEIGKNIINAIDYINGRPVSGDIILRPSCTDFQFAVYQALMQIPAGTTVNYKDVAAAIGRPETTRAVANAIAWNPIALLIPCHRVVPAAGGYGKYRWGPALKRSLIAAELKK